MQRHPLIPHLVVTAAALAALVCGVAPRAAAQRPAAGPGSLELAEVRGVFERVDGDADGRLLLREADHGGVDAQGFARFDVDADGTLDRDEFVVARHALSTAADRRPAADLVAESTRIQAAWRARQALETGRGPSAARLRGRAERPGGSSAAGSTAVRGDRVGAPLLTQRTPAYPLEVAGGLPPALGLTRLGGRSTPAALSKGLSLEDRARAAQELIEARLEARQGPWRGRVVVQAPSGSRVAPTAVPTEARHGPVEGRVPRSDAIPSGAQRPGSQPELPGGRAQQRPGPGPAAGRSRSTARSGGGPR